MAFNDGSGPTTQLIHCHRQNGSSESRSHVSPIFQTSTFRFDSVEQGMEIFAGKVKYDAYSRISNPNHRALEEALCVMEEGEAAQVFDSGMTAIKVVLLSLLKSGDEIIAHKNLYGGTIGLLHDITNFGIKTIFVDARDERNVLDKLTPQTRMVFVETPSNPVLDICDFERIKSDICNFQMLAKAIELVRNDVLVVVDNTFATPVNQKPPTRGADISIQSLTKYINGFGNATGGAIITSAKIMERIWERYHGSGGMMEPEVAQRISLNMITLPYRMERHNKNAFKIADWLAFNPLVRSVYYPGLLEHPNYNVARILMPGGFGGMISFELIETEDTENCATKTFLNKLSKDQRAGEGIITLAVSLGCVDTLICCPALSTHYSIPKEERLVEGISDNLIRLSVGIEDADDIISSLKKGFQALK